MDLRFRTLTRPERGRGAAQAIHPASPVKTPRKQRGAGEVVEDECPPHPDDARVEHQGREESDRDPKHPVADRGGDEGCGGIAGTAMCAAEGEVKLKEGLANRQGQHKRAKPPNHGRVIGEEFSQGCPQEAKDHGEGKRGH